MKLGEKIPLAERQLAFLLRHDDASPDERQVLADRLKAFIDAEMDAARGRYKTRMKEEEEVQRKRMTETAPAPHPVKEETTSSKAKKK